MCPCDTGRSNVILEIWIYRMFPCDTGRSKVILEIWIYIMCLCDTGRSKVKSLILVIELSNTFDNVKHILTNELQNTFFLGNGMFLLASLIIKLHIFQGKYMQMINMQVENLGSHLRS